MRATAWRDRLGLAKGDRVGILADNRVEFLDVFFAAGKSGVILVPLGTRADRRTSSPTSSATAGMRALVYDGEFADTVRELRAAGRRSTAGSPSTTPSTPATSAGPSLLSRTPEPRTPDPGLARGPLLPPLHQRHHRQAQGRDGPAPDGGVERRTTRRSRWQLREDDVSPDLHPALPRRRPRRVPGADLRDRRHDRPARRLRRRPRSGATIERERCTVVLGVPTIWKLLMEAPEFATVDLSSCAG